MEVNLIISNELIANDIKCLTLPMADGGEGSLDIIRSMEKTDVIQVDSYDPCHQPITACCLVEDDIAYIEMAAVNGLMLVPDYNRKLLELSTYGTGVLIKHVIELGVKNIVLFLGGSATVDGGTGLLYALAGEGIPCSNPLLNFSSSVLSEAARLLNNTEVTLVTDVFNVICGESGAARVFGPQKGASETEVELLEKHMQQWVGFLEQVANKSLVDVQGLGAAGGTGLGLYALTKTRIVSGFGYFSRLLDYSAALDKCEILVTGEGCIDEQTLMGKGVGSLACEAQKRDKTVIGIGGMVKLKPPVFHRVFSTSVDEMSHEDMKTTARQRLKNTAQQLAYYIKNIG